MRQQSKENDAFNMIESTTATTGNKGKRTLRMPSKSFTASKRGVEGTATTLNRDKSTSGAIGFAVNTDTNTNANANANKMGAKFGIRTEMVQIATVSSPESEATPEVNFKGNNIDINNNNNNNSVVNNVNISINGEQPRSSILSETREESDSDGGLYRSGVDLDKATTRGNIAINTPSSGAVDNNIPLNDPNGNDIAKQYMSSVHSTPNSSMMAILAVAEGVEDLKSNPESEGIVAKNGSRNNPNADKRFSGAVHGFNADKFNSSYAKNVNTRINSRNESHGMKSISVSDVSDIFNQSRAVAGYESNSNSNDENENENALDFAKTANDATKLKSRYSKKVFTHGRGTPTITYKTSTRVPRSTNDLINMDLNESQRSLNSNATNGSNTANTTNTAPYGAVASDTELNYPNKQTELTSEGTNDNNNNLISVMPDIRNFGLWTNNELSTWLQNELVECGFDIQSIASFMGQFNELQMTGKVLKLWINQAGGDKKKLLKKFQSRIEFNSKSTIWDILIESIYNIQ